MLFSGTLTNSDGDQAAVTLDVTPAPEPTYTLTASASLTGTTAVVAWSYDGPDPASWTVTVDGTPRTAPGVDRGVTVTDLAPGEHIFVVTGAGLEASASVTVPEPVYTLAVSASLSGSSAVLSWSYDGPDPIAGWAVDLDGTPRATAAGSARGMSVDLTPGAHTLTVTGAGHTASATVTVPQPTYPVPVAGQAVTIGTATHVVDAVNAPRDVNKLVAYTRVGAQVATPTNQWGVEVVVAFGRVVTVVNRLAGNITTGTTIPAEGYVLSGHGLGAGYAGQWLLDNATVGTTVAVGTAPDPQPQPSGDALPAKIVGAYVNMYQGPAVAELPDYNVIFAAFALGAGGQAMHFIAPAKESDASFRAGIIADQARGAKWILSIGGGVPAAERTIIQTEAHATAVFNALVPIIDSYGFDGLDYDLENGPSGFTQAGLLSLSRKLRTKYGTGFAITMTPRPYENFYFTIAAAHHAEGLLDALQFQFYDAMETRDDAYLASWIPARLDAAKAAGVPYSKMVVGCITQVGYAYGWNDAATYGAIIRNMMSSRGIRGAMVWDTAQEKQGGYPFWNMAKNL